MQINNKNKPLGMKRQQQPRRISSSINSLQKQIYYQLHYLSCFIECFPKTTQHQMLPYLQYLKSQPFCSQVIKQKLVSMQKKIGISKELATNYKQARNCFSIFNKIITTASFYNEINGKKMAKIIAHFKGMQDSIHLLQTDSTARAKFQKKFNAEYYPETIDKNDCLSKQFQMSYRLSKMYGNQNLSHHDRKAKDPIFEINPRLIHRLQQIMHYQSNAQHLGSIILMTYEGHKIIGKKSYVVLNNNTIQHWQKRSMQPPQINLTIQNQQQVVQVKPTSIAQQPISMSPNPIPSSQRLKLSQILYSHTEKITCASLSYDQLYLLSVGVDRVVKLWDLRLKVVVADFYGHVATIWHVNWAHTGYYFITAAADNMAILWKTDIPNPQRIFQHHAEVYKADFMGNPDYVVTAGEQGILRIWRIMTGQCIRQIAFPTSILNFELSFSGSYIGLYESSSQISIYDLSKGQKINSFNILQGDHTTSFQVQNSNSKKPKCLKPHDLAFSQDQKQFVVVTSKHIMLYSMDSLGQKTPTNIYEAEEKKSKKQEPKEVIYMGRDVNLTYAKYTRKRLLVVAGTKRAN